MTRGWPVLRIAVAALIVAAVIAQLARSVQTASATQSDIPTMVVNFFSFFTIESNIAAAVVLLIAGLAALSRRPRTSTEPAWLARLLVYVTTYMVITGVVYNLLLRSIELPQGQTVAWSNEVLHTVGPAFLLIDLIVAPGRRRLPWRTVPETLVFPILWLAYTLIRGPHATAPQTGETGWYPYPFLNPNGAGGVASVSAYIVVIAVAFTVVASVVVGVGRRRDRYRSTSPEMTPTQSPPTQMSPPSTEM